MEPSLEIGLRDSPTTCLLCPNSQPLHARRAPCRAPLHACRAPSCACRAPLCARRALLANGRMCVTEHPPPHHTFPSDLNRRHADDSQPFQRAKPQLGPAAAVVAACGGAETEDAKGRHQLRVLWAVGLDCVSSEDMEVGVDAACAGVEADGRHQLRVLGPGRLDGASCEDMDTCREVLRGNMSAHEIGRCERGPSMKSAQSPLATVSQSEGYPEPP